jgi:hypothetical protein
VVSGLEVFAKEERDCAQVKGYEYSILPLSSKKYFRIVACAREVEDMFAAGESCDACLFVFGWLFYLTSGIPRRIDRSDLI